MPQCGCTEKSLREDHEEVEIHEIQIADWPGGFERPRGAVQPADENRGKVDHPTSRNESGADTTGPRGSTVQEDAAEGREPVVDEGYDPTKPLELVQKPAAEPAAASQVVCFFVRV